MKITDDEKQSMKNISMRTRNLLIVSLCASIFLILVMAPRTFEKTNPYLRITVGRYWTKLERKLINGFMEGGSSSDIDLVKKTLVYLPNIEDSEIYLPNYPLKISANGRYLADQNNQPYFISGDASWSLIVQGTVHDIDVYLANRHQKRVNMILVNLIDHRFGTFAPSNIYGERPFTHAPFTTPNEAYFTLADYVISSAAKYGIAVLLDPLYIGYKCNNDGWCAEMQTASTSDLYSWGEYVGNRYVNFDNIVWIIGGDVDPTDYQLEKKVNAFIEGLQSADTRHLITAHNDRGQMAVTPWNGASWITLNNTYTVFNETYQLAQAAFEFTPAMPFFHVEGFYENDTNSMTNQKLRAQAYWTILQGGIGYIFGNCPVWGLGYPAMDYCPGTDPDWKAQLDYPGIHYMGLVQELFTSRAWQNLTPDFSHTFLTAGYGTYGDINFATTGVANDGSIAISYLPTIRTVTVDLTKMSSFICAYWYDPSNGSYSTIEGSPFPNTISHEFTPSGSNGDGDSDWILLLEIR